MRKLRTHQTDILSRAKSIIDGQITELKTVALVTPGAGKSLMATIFSKQLLDAKKIERTIWLCPRKSLIEQASSGFRDKDFNPYYSARAADNTPPLFRDTAKGQIAYISSYQAVAAQPSVHLRECSLYKYLLILDEPHHLKDEEAEVGSWTKYLNELVSGACHTLLMSGTIERHDKKLIPYIDYEEDGGKLFPRKDVIYSRFDALLEESIIPIDFQYEKGWSKFEDDHGEHNVEISTATDAEVSAVIQTFLRKTEFRDRLLTRGLEHWVEQRKKYKSRCIVICASQDMAREVSKQIASLYSKCEVALAISDDPKSNKVIKAFRKKEFGHILVTVGMAYEGLDVPDCKHMICLTDIRSIPWLEQAFARVTRVDYSSGLPYSAQRATIFVPDDPRMRAIVTALEEEQDKGIKIKKERVAKLEEEEIKDSRNAPGATFKPLGATSSGTETGSLDAQGINEILATMAPPLIIEEDEKDIRKKIEMLARRRDITRRLPRGSTNRLLMSNFGKPRPKMGMIELRKVLNYITDLIRMGK